MTASTSPTPVATDVVILARASFSGSETNWTSVFGCSCLKSSWREIASSICGLDTMATTRVVPPSPEATAPAPAQPLSSAAVVPRAPSTASGRAGRFSVGNRSSFSAGPPRRLGSSIGLDLHLHAGSGTHEAERGRVFVQRQGVGEQFGGAHAARGHQVDGGAVAVQHGHGADHGDLVVVDAERRQRDAGVVGRYPEDQQPAAAAQRAEGRLDGGGRAGGVGSGVETPPVELAGAGGGGGGAQVLGELQALGVAVDYGDLGAALLQQLLEQQPHGARADQQEALAGRHADAAYAVDRARERLDQCGSAAAHLFGQA